MTSHGQLPVFTVESFDGWKIRMKAFLASVHDEMLDVITSGPIIPMKNNDLLFTVDGSRLGRIVKPKEEYDNTDRKRANLDNLCKSILFQSLGDVMFHRVKHCETSKDIWDTICKLCEGSDKIRKSKLDMQITRFKTIKMKDGETIENYEIRLSGVLNELIFLSHIVPPAEVNYKILDSLSKAWEVKAEVTKAVISASTPTNELWADLKAHEFDKMKGKLERGETTSDNLALSVEAKSSEVVKSSESDLMAMFMKKMDKFERNLTRRWATTRTEADTVISTGQIMEKRQSTTITMIPLGHSTMIKGLNTVIPQDHPNMNPTLNTNRRVHIRVSTAQVTNLIYSVITVKSLVTLKLIVKNLGKADIMMLSAGIEMLSGAGWMH